MFSDPQLLCAELKVGPESDPSGKGWPWVFSGHPLPGYRTLTCAGTPSIFPCFCSVSLSSQTQVYILIFWFIFSLCSNSNNVDEIFVVCARMRACSRVYECTLGSEPRSHAHSADAGPFLCLPATLGVQSVSEIGRRPFWEFWPEPSGEPGSLFFPKLSCVLRLSEV